LGPRVTSDLLLVGSLPAESSEAAMRSAAELYGDLVFAVPDGETGMRALWVGYDVLTMVLPNPGIESAMPQEAPPPPAIPRHLYEMPTLTLRDRGAGLRFDSWPRIDEAIASYQTFRRLREQGVIPAGLRFQVGLPFPFSLLSNFRGTAGEYAVAERACEDLVSRELPRLMSQVPPEDLAIQWDVCYEVLDNEGVLPWTADGAWERFTGPVARIANLVPEEVLAGYHLCYGTYPDWPMYEARDLSLLVRMANHAVASSGRTVDWVHLAGPRYLRSEEDRFFRPLADLDVGDTRVFLGIVLPIDGVAGLRRRQATASKHLARFGVAMYCGFGRQPGHDGAQTMREHASVVRAAHRPARSTPAS
jgi:hypothetical protein